MREASWARGPSRGTARPRPGLLLLYLRREGLDPGLASPCASISLPWGLEKCRISGPISELGTESHSDETPGGYTPTKVSVAGGWRGFVVAPLFPPVQHAFPSLPVKAPWFPLGKSSPPPPPIEVSPRDRDLGHMLHPGLAHLSIRSAAHSDWVIGSGNSRVTV